MHRLVTAAVLAATALPLHADQGFELAPDVFWVGNAPVLRTATLVANPSGTLSVRMASIPQTPRPRELTARDLKVPAAPAPAVAAPPPPAPEPQVVYVGQSWTKPGTNYMPTLRAPASSNNPLLPRTTIAGTTESTTEAVLSSGTISIRTTGASYATTLPLDRARSPSGVLILGGQSFQTGAIGPAGTKGYSRSVFLIAPAPR